MASNTHTHINTHIYTYIHLINDYIHEFRKMASTLFFALKSRYFGNFSYDKVKVEWGKITGGRGNKYKLSAINNTDNFYLFLLFHFPVPVSPCIFCYYSITRFFLLLFSNILLESFFIVIDFRPVCFRLFGLKIHLVCLTSFKKHFDRKPQKQKCQMQNILRVEPEIAPTFMRRIKLHNKCL